MIFNTRFEKLLEPHHIGPVKTRNRMMKTGAAMMYWHEDELHMNEKTKAYYEAIARGGIGLLIVESPTIDYPLGARWREQYRIDDDKYIQGLSELVEVIHKHGCPTFMQMCHVGPWRSPLFPNLPATFSGPPIGASPVNLDVPGDFHRDLPRELTIPEIQVIINKYASAAVRAQKAGFDGVDINAGSSHLLHSFLSPFWNRRQDAYGGTLGKRARFLVGIIREIKKRAGQDFPVSVLINAIEIGQALGIENNKCLTVEDSRKIAKILQEAGADAIQVRNHWLGYHVGGFLPDYLFYPEPPIPLKEFPKEYNWKHRGAGANVYLSEGIKKVVSIPVIVVGKISPKLGEKVLREGKADFIAMTRGLFCDPELPNKIASGRLEDIAPCTACGTCLDQSISMARRCRINAALGTSVPYEIKQAEKRKKVVVIGGGPAGMEAARVAALRGHEVILYEKTRQLGGLVPLAALIKGIELENLPDLVRYLKTQINKLGVKTKLGKEVDSSIIERIKPDVVIIATGGKLTVSGITGINKNVITTPDLHRMTKSYLRFLGPRILGWLTKFLLPVGRKVVIIGSGLHGMEVAEFLVKRGRRVTIADTAEVPGEGMIDFRLGLLLDWFNKKGVTMINGVKSMEITDKGLNITNKEGEKQTLEAESIISISLLAPNTGLLKSLEGKAPEVYAIGDCREPRLIADAIADGWEIARKI